MAYVVLGLNSNPYKLQMFTKQKAFIKLEKAKAKIIAKRIITKIKKQTKMAK